MVAALAAQDFVTETGMAIADMLLRQAPAMGMGAHAAAETEEVLVIPAVTGNVTGSEKANQSKEFEMTKTQMFDSMVGKFCIVRSGDAGVHAGRVLEATHEAVLLDGSRRLWEWKTNNGIALTGVAVHGVDHDESTLDSLNPRHILIVGYCELIECSPQAEVSILTAPGA